VITAVVLLFGVSIMRKMRVAYMMRMCGDGGSGHGATDRGLTESMEGTIAPSVIGSAACGMAVSDGPLLWITLPHATT